MTKDWLTCPALAYYRHFLRRGIPIDSSALELGTFFHSYMEARLKTMAGAEGILPPEPKLGEDALKEWLKLEPFAREWALPHGWKVVIVEAPMELPFQKHILQGKLDAIVEWNGGFWSLQWKTCASSTNLEAFSESVRIGWHECAYQYLAENNGFRPFLGTILVTAKKLSQKALTEGRNPIAVQYLPRDRALVERRLEDLNTLVDQMQIGFGFSQKEVPPHSMPMNVDSCFGRFGNHKCDYFGVCHDGDDLMSGDYAALPDRYAPAEPQSE